jgi:xanthine dehydrogenase accessory factor
MNENELLATTVNARLTAGQPLVLISLISLQGSTPRHSGTKMLVTADGKPCGTIGGSLIEATAIEEARGVLAAGKPKIISFELSGQDAAAPGMICGGRAEILLDYIPASPENKAFSSYWQNAILKGRDFYLLTLIKGKGRSLQVTGHAVLYPDGETQGSTPLPASDIALLKPELHTVSASAVLTVKDMRVLVDRVRKLKTVYCFGAGHVAVPTAHLAALAGFRVVVVDDRAEFACAERFPEAHDIRVIGDFRRAFAGLEIDEDSFIVIVTRGHRFDREVLEKALPTSAGYIGMISSRHKKEAIFAALLTAGVDKERLEKVHSPIGIDIGGETPEEIAVSIVAELIQVRSGQAP